MKQVTEPTRTVAPPPVMRRERNYKNLFFFHTIEN